MTTNIDEMVRLAKIDAENVLRSELGAARYQVMLNCAKKDTDSARNDVVQLSEGVSRSRELTRRRTLEHAQNIEECGKHVAAKHEYESQIERAKRAQSELVIEVSNTQDEYNRHTSLLQQYSTELSEALAAEAATKAELLSVETKLEDVLSRLRTSHAALDAATSQNHVLISELAACAEASGSAKATLHSSTTNLEEARLRDEQSKLSHVESQRVVGVQTTKFQTQEAVLATCETKLSELIAELRAHEHEVARQRDLTNKAAAELEAANQAERVASQVSLDTQRAVHVAEDVLAQATIDVEATLLREKDVTLKVEPSKQQLTTCSSSYNAICAELEAVKSEASILQQSAKSASEYVLGMQTKTNAQQHVQDEVHLALQQLTSTLTATEVDIEGKQVALETVTASLKVLEAAESSTAVELQALKSETETASNLLIQAENALRTKSTAEKAISEAALKSLAAMDTVSAHHHPVVHPPPPPPIPVSITSPMRLC
eukprot:TRINITY_DN27490_c0_g1_i1.p1 TRINITY_DN27490_c0_g1~~TRINITY_DN27490_c0_g1_i1.p1  ORF type:complete len:491 (+),score=136.50 TRINITY_DN27490_c0_g1_i1:52-1524(+)